MRRGLIVIILSSILLSGVYLFVIADRKAKEREKFAKEIVTYYDGLERRLRTGDEKAVVELIERLEGEFSPVTATTMAYDIFPDIAEIHHRKLAEWLKTNIADLVFEKQSRQFVLRRGRITTRPKK